MCACQWMIIPARTCLWSSEDNFWELVSFLSHGRQRLNLGHQAWRVTVLSHLAPIQASITLAYLDPLVPVGGGVWREYLQVIFQLQIIAVTALYLDLFLEMQQRKKWWALPLLFAQTEHISSPSNPFVSGISETLYSEMCHKLDSYKPCRFLWYTGTLICIGQHFTLVSRAFSSSGFFSEANFSCTLSLQRGRVCW